MRGGGDRASVGEPPRLSSIGSGWSGCTVRAGRRPVDRTMWRGSCASPQAPRGSVRPRHRISSMMRGGLGFAVLLLRSRLRRSARAHAPGASARCVRARLPRLRGAVAGCGAGQTSRQSSEYSRVYTTRYADGRPRTATRLHPVFPDARAKNLPYTIYENSLCVSYVFILVSRYRNGAYKHTRGGASPATARATTAIVNEREP